MKNITIRFPGTLATYDSCYRFQVVDKGEKKEESRARNCFLSINPQFFCKNCNISNVMCSLVRCFLCRKKSPPQKVDKRVESSLCPVSKKSVKTVLQHLARCAKIELHIPPEELLCKNCYYQIVEYDSSLMSMTRKQRCLTQLVEKAAISIDSDVEDECNEHMATMDELNDDHFFDDANVSENEISQTILEAIHGSSVPRRNTIIKSCAPQSESPSSRQEKELLQHALLQCNLCAMRFRSKNRLKIHVAQAHKKFSCELCTYSHRNKDYVLLHMNLHEGKNENQCRFCEKEFSTKISTIRHMEVHMDSKKYQCDKCGLCFSQTTVLYNHKLQHEAEEEPLRCEICNQIFKTKRTYRHHMITHRADRPRYSCEFCAKTFTEKYTLKVHKRTHPEAGVHTISVHQQKQTKQQTITILQSEAIQTPADTVETGAKFNCIICDQPFINKDNLNRHMEKEHDVILKSLTLTNFSQYEVVTNESRRPCQICGQMFSMQSNLDYHLEHVHGVNFK